MPKARETCTECSLRRQRCNRQIPCDRCVRRGIAAACTRHWPERADPRCRALARPTRPATQRRGRTSRGEDLSSNVAGRDSPLSSESNAGGSAAPPSAGRCASTAFQPNSCGVCTNQQQCSLENANVSGSSVARPAPNRRGAPASTELGTLQLQLPDLNQIWHLVDFHERYLLWYHGCYHGPTFRSELKDALSNDGHGELDVASLNMQWLALLFAIMAGSLSCSPDTISSAWGFWKEEVPELSMQWYRATVTCLNLASYTTDHRLYSVQAITTLGMSAHTLGLSEDLSVLLAAALRIARSLGIDRIEQTSPSEEVNHDSTGAQRKQVLRREVGRRLWSQLCVQDWLAIPFQGSQCINLSDYTTSKPSNREFMTMDPLPANVPTYVSYGNYLYDIAKLIAEHHAAVARSSTPFTRYRRVLEFDARMKHLARRDMPEYFRVTMPVDPEWPEWVPWARRSLTICFAHKVLMIHRAFIRQSFTNAAFHVTRATCIAASTTILREAKIEMEEQGPIIWIDQAFCIVAGIVLCLSIFHLTSSEPEYCLHLNLVQDCIEILQRFENSAVACRGVRLLSRLLSERERSQGSPRSNLEEARESSDSNEASSLKQSLDIADIVGCMPDATHHVDPLSLTPTSIQEHDTCPDSAEEIEFAQKRHPELLPPQAGFSNRFLWEVLFADLF